MSLDYLEGPTWFELQTAIWIDIPVLYRAVDYVNIRHVDELPYGSPMTYDVSYDILKRFNMLCALEPRESWGFKLQRDLIRQAASAQLGIDEAEAEYYRKVIAAYLRFPKKVEFEQLEYVH